MKKNCCESTQYCLVLTLGMTGFFFFKYVAGIYQIISILLDNKLDSLPLLFYHFMFIVINEACDYKFRCFIFLQKLQKKNNSFILYSNVYCEFFATSTHPIRKIFVGSLKNKYE